MSTERGHYCRYVVFLFLLFVLFFGGQRVQTLSVGVRSASRCLLVSVFILRRRYLILKRKRKTEKLKRRCQA